MRITVRVKPNAKEGRIEKIDEDWFLVSVKEPPIRGKANEAVVVALAEYFKVAPQNVRIISGKTSKLKTIDIIG